METHIMYSCFLDIETTGISVYNNEIIEAFFFIHKDGKKVSEYLLQSQVDSWSTEAEEIHGISYAETLMYPKKEDAFRSFLLWLKDFKNFRFISFANKNTMEGRLNFDVASLENTLDLLGCKPYYLKNEYGMKQNISAHNLSREAVKDGLFAPVRGDSGRASLSQENVFKALFGEEYNGHRAKNDVIYLERIYYRLIELRHGNKNLFTFECDNRKTNNKVENSQSQLL